MSEPEETTNVPKKTTAILEETKKDLSDKKIVAFLGDVDSGKTVVATLLNDAIFSFFLPKYEKEFAANIVKGYDVIAGSEKSMFSGKFPDPTPKPSPPYEIEIEIARKNELGSKTSLRIRDISGEDYRELFLGADMEANERIREVLTRGRGKAVYGPMSYLIFAKIYILLIDCSLFPTWKTLDLRQAQSINTILQFKNAIQETTNEKITTPIAIVLTKTDRLSDDMDESPEIMLQKYMPKFYYTFNNIHVGPKEYFKVSVEPTETVDTTVNTEPKKAVKLPLTYTSDEYVKLILWIIKNIPQ